MKTKRRVAPARSAAAVLVLTLGLTAGLGVGPGARTALAGDGAATTAGATHAARSSGDTPPTGSERSPTYGDANPGSETYDTNWIFDASSGDSDAIWYRVTGASIEGTGNVTTDDSDSIERLTKSAWGCEIVTFSVPCGPDEDACITVTNDIDIQAAWTISSNGMNTAYLEAAAYDINGQKHAMTIVKQVAGSVSVTTTSGSRNASQQTDTAQAGTSATGPTVSGTSVDGMTQESSASQSQTSTSGSAEAGSKELTEVVVVSYPASSVTVTIASTETMDLSARALVEDKATMVNVPKFDTVNGVVAIANVTRRPKNVTPPPPAPTTPPGPGGPSTPDGNGTGPTTPSPGPEPGAPTTPSEPKKPDDPAPPVTPK